MAVWSQVLELMNSWVCLKHSLLISGSWKEKTKQHSTLGTTVHLEVLFTFFRTAWQTCWAGSSCVFTRVFDVHRTGCTIQKDQHREKTTWRALTALTSLLSNPAKRGRPAAGFPFFTSIISSLKKCPKRTYLAKPPYRTLNFHVSKKCCTPYLAKPFENEEHVVVATKTRRVRCEADDAGPISEGQCRGIMRKYNLLCVTIC